MKPFLYSTRSPSSQCIEIMKTKKREASKAKKEAYISQFPKGEKRSIIRRMLGL